MTTTTVTSNRAQTVVVDRGYHWRPIDASTPRSQKLQLINRGDGVAVYGAIGTDTTWTHWAPLPSFAPAHQPRADVDEWAGLPRQHAPADRRSGPLTDASLDGLSFRAFAKAVGMLVGMIFLGLSAGWLVEQLR